MPEPANSTPEEQDESLAGQARRMAGPFANFIPEDMMRTVTDALNPFQNMLDSFMSAINDLVLGIFNKPQKAAKEAFLADLRANADDFTSLATGLGLTPELGEALLKECERTAKDAFTKEMFGLTGISRDPEVNAQRLIDLNSSLERRILRDLVKANPNESDETLQRRAQDAALQITGINPEHLGSQHAAARIAASPPTSGFGAQLFGIQRGVVEGADPITVPQFTMGAAPAAAPAAPAAEAPAGQAPAKTPEQQKLEQAYIWMRHFQSDARGDKQLAFRDLNGDNEINGYDLATALRGVTVEDIRDPDAFYNHITANLEAAGARKVRG